MAGGKMQGFEQAVLNTSRGSNITAPANVYIGILTTNPSDDTGTGAVEASYTGNGGGTYARKLAGYGAPSSSGPSSMSNGADILFEVWGAGGTIVGIAEYDAASGGTMRKRSGTLNVVVPAGGQPKISAGQLTSTED